MYKKILVPHAGTPAGDEALKHALHAANESSKIIILHIIEEIQHPLTFALADSEREKLLGSINEANESIRQDMGKEMEKRVALCSEKNIDVQVNVEIGDAAQIILDTVNNEDIDLLVMAKRRKLKGVKKLLTLGSVSRKVIEHVTCPVLLIDIEKL